MTVDPRSSVSVSSTLLVRLRQQDPDAWQRLVQLYGPTVYGWCRHAGLRPADAADATQEVFRSVANGLENFRRDRQGDSFRGWLAAIARNRIRDHFRRVAQQPQVRGGTDFHQQVQALPDLIDAASTEDGDVVDSQQRGVLRRAVALVEAEFEPRTWQAFWRTAVEHAAPADVASDLGVSVNAVYKAKSRVLRRLREELAGLLD